MGVTANNIRRATVMPQLSRLTIQVEDSTSPVSEVTFHGAATKGLSEESLRDALTPFGAAVTEINRALTTAHVPLNECIEITTKEGTTIRIGCGGTVTLGQPRIS
jgi:hypothetical protein